MAIELVPFDKLKSLLELEDNEADYPALTLIQESVVAAFEAYTGRVFTEDKYTNSVDIIFPSKMVSLNAIPVNTITEVTVDGIVMTDYKIRLYGIELGSPVDNRTVEVSYRGGLKEVPASLERAALLQTTYEYQNSTHIGAKLVSTEGGTVTLPELNLLKVVKGILKSYMHPLNRMM